MICVCVTQEVDIGLMPFTPTRGRGMVMDFSSPLYFNTYSIYYDSAYAYQANLCVEAQMKISKIILKLYMYLFLAPIFSFVLELKKRSENYIIRKKYYQIIINVA